MREMRNSQRILVGKPEVKKPFRRPRHRRYSNIKMDVTEIGLKDVDLIHLAHDRGWCWG
jgi:hypothetical protein